MLNKLDKLVLILCFFPFLGTGDGDLRPYFLFGMIALFFFRIYAIKKYIFLFAILLISGIYSLRFDLQIEDQLRYLAYLIVPFLALTVIKYDKNYLVKLANVALYIYFLYAVLQWFDLNFLDQWINYREALKRGVKSITPEPSMFGFTLALIMAILIANNKINKFSIFAYLMSLLLCASASAIIANLPIIFGLALSFGITYLSLFVTIFFVGLSIIDLPERLIFLLSSPTLENLIMDASVNERLGHIFTIFTNFNFYIFGGDLAWGDYYPTVLFNSSFFYYGSDSNNILSGLGGIVYIYGIFGIIFLFSIWSKIRPNTNSFLKKMTLLSWFFTALQSVSFAHPLLIISLMSFNEKDYYNRT